MSDIVERESIATGITMEVEELQRQNRDSFQIPEWFLYTSRAFLTLEGVSLQADENYSIIRSCFPYIAKRLLADDDERARKALKDLLYGATGVVNVERLSDLADGFTSYTTITKTINVQAKSPSGEIVTTSGQFERVSTKEGQKKRMIEAEAAVTLIKDAADILLATDGNVLQNLLVEESALAASANFKDSIRAALVDGPQLFRNSLPLGIGSLFPELPFEHQLTPFVRKTPKEQRAQQFAVKLLDTSTRQARRESESPFVDVTTAQALFTTLRELNPEQTALVMKELRENIPTYAPMLAGLGGKFIGTLLRTASSSIDTTVIELELAGEQTNVDVVQAVAKGLSSAAERGAGILAPEDGRAGSR
jgi:uncharacterized protein (DUF2267 family)